jgi:hypothetical protein
MAYKLHYEQDTLLRKRYLHNDANVSTYYDKFSIRQAVKIKKRVGRSYGVCAEQERVNGGSHLIDGYHFCVVKPC